MAGLILVTFKVLKEKVLFCKISAVEQVSNKLAKTL